MKNLKSKLIVTAMLIFGITVFMSCEKNNETLIENDNASIKISLKKKKISVNDLINPNNPFDIYGVKMEKIYIDLKNLIETDSISSIEVYNLKINEILSKNSDVLYPNIDTTNYDEFENSFIKKLYKINNLNELIHKSRNVENNIIRSKKLTSIQKERLLSITSQIKFSKFYIISMWGNNNICAPNFDDCMRNHLGDIFQDDGNPVPETAFVAGMPASFFWVVATCAYEQAFL